MFGKEPIIQVTVEDAMGLWLDRRHREVLSRNREPPAWHWVWGSVSHLGLLCALCMGIGGGGGTRLGKQKSPTMKMKDLRVQPTFPTGDGDTETDCMQGQMGSQLCPRRS